MSRTVVLLCTVGGSHQPILRAIGTLAPSYICFFCTDRDPDTGRPGSIVQVTAKGNVIKAAPNDAQPTLPNIPSQAGLNNERLETRTVPPDDLDSAYLTMRHAMAELAGRFSDARLIADYTGGTKTMSAALVSAALDSDDVELQLIAGARHDLVRVQDRTEQVAAAQVAHLRLDRAMGRYLDAWRRFAYQEAADGLGGILSSTDEPGRMRLGLAYALSRALARWDDFDHSGALELIETHDAQVAASFPAMLPALRLLAEETDVRNTPARLFDLWLNAERCAAQGRFDDAAARWHRLMEWTAQWQLKTELRTDTADFPAALQSRGVGTASDQNGRGKLGLWKAWQVVKHHLSGGVQRFVAEHGETLRNLLDMRNNSILAHGFRPVRAQDWKRMHSFTTQHFLPVLTALANGAGLKRDRMPTQLPTVPPDVPGPWLNSNIGTIRDNCN